MGQIQEIADNVRVLLQVGEVLFHPPRTDDEPALTLKSTTKSELDNVKLDMKYSIRTADEGNRVKPVFWQTLC